MRAIAAVQLEALSNFCTGGSVGSIFVGALLMLPFLQEKNVVDAIEGRVGNNKPSLGADAAAQGTTSQGEAGHQEQV